MCRLIDDIFFVHLMNFYNRLLTVKYNYINIDDISYISISYYIFIMSLKVIFTN